jgi:hypothetical protein
MLDTVFGLAARAVNVLPARRVFEARDRRARGQRGAIVERQPCRPRLEHRIVAQVVGVVAIFVAARNLIDPLRQNVVIRVIDLTLVAAVGQGCGDAPRQADLEVDSAQQHGTRIGRQAAAGEIGAHTVGWNGGEAQLLRGEFMPGKVLQVLMGGFRDNSDPINHLRHSCPFFMQNSGSWRFIRFAGPAGLRRRAGVP